MVRSRIGGYYRNNIRVLHFLPLSEGTTCETLKGSQNNFQVVQFAAYLSLEEKAYSTVHTYLAGIGTKHRLNGWDDPTDNFLLKKLMQGFAKTDKRSDPRLPLTLQRLQQLVNVLPSVCTNTFEVKLFKAAFTLPLCFFLRVSELVGQGMGDRCSRQGLKMADINIGKDLTISIQGSKQINKEKGHNCIWVQLVIQQLSAQYRQCGNIWRYDQHLGNVYSSTSMVGL